MAHLSIRKLPPELEKAIQREAKKKNTTKTSVVLEALMSAFYSGRPSSRIHRNVRSFFGKMTPSQYEEFKKVTGDFSSVDEEMWK